MAAAGAVVGGGTIFAGNNAVYAAENEQGVIGSQSEEQIIESQSVSESTTESLSQSKSETSSFESEGAVETSAVEGNTVPDENKMTSEETVADENEMTSEESSTSISTAESIVKSESYSASDAKSEALIESENFSNSESESLLKSEANYIEDSKSISLAASESASQFKSEYQEGLNSLSQAKKDFESNSNRIDKYEKLCDEIVKLQEELESVHQSILKQSNPSLNTSYDGKRSWYQVANDLSIKLAKYYFFQEYGVGEIKGDSGDWHRDGEGGSYDVNYIYLEYTDANGVVHKGYFDYIEANDSGYLSIKNPKDVTQVVVLKKETAYVNTSTVKVNGYWTKIDGNYKYITEEIKCNYYYSKTDENGNVKHYLKISGDLTYNEIDSSRVIVNTDGSISVQNGNETLTFTRQNDKTWYGKDIGRPPFVDVPNLYDQDKLNTDTIKGTPYFSTIKFNDRDTQYDKENKSEFNSVSQSLSRLLSKSVSLSKSNVDNSTSKVNSKSESTEISNSNSTSLSEKEELIKSTSLSLSNQKSEAVSLSQSVADSTSASQSEVDSTSASQSEVDSTSASQLEVDSTSASQNEADSTSGSLSSSESASTSESYATSVSTSTTGGGIAYRQVVVDTRAPLQVAPRVSEEEVVEDDVTPKAKEETIEKEKMPKSTLDVAHRVWWSWIPIVGALISSNETRKRRKEEKEKEKEESKDKKMK